MARPIPPRPALIVLNTLVMQRGDLLRDEADQKQRQRINQEHGAHVGKAVHGGVGVTVIQNASEEEY